MQCYSSVILLVLVAAVSAQETYTGKWNDVDTCAIIKNERLFKKYKDCILGETTMGCPQDALELKRVLDEALKTTCAKCSPVHEEKIKRTFECMCADRPNDFAELLQHFDAEKKYRPAFEEKFGKLAGNC